MTIQDVATNLLAITKKINNHSTPEDFMQAGDFIIGQMVANPDIEILDYFDQYPILDDIDSCARSIAVGDGRYDNTLDEVWSNLVGCIEAFHEQVQDDSQSLNKVGLTK